MTLIRLIMSFVMMMFALGMYSQSASAFEVVDEGHRDYQSDVVVGKVVDVELKTIVVADSKWERQAVTSYSQLEQNGIVGDIAIAQLNEQDFWTKIPTEPAWRT